LVPGVLIATLGHGDHQGIVLLGANHGKPDVGVAARGLDHGLTGLELAARFGVLDDPEGDAVKTLSPTRARRPRHTGDEFLERVRAKCGARVSRAGGYFGSIARFNTP